MCSWQDLETEILRDSRLGSIRLISDSVDIPVIANGDVVDTESAKLCLEATNAGGLMIGRGAIGRPTFSMR